jgi:hypothetical protein
MSVSVLQLSLLVLLRPRASADNGGLAAWRPGEADSLPGINDALGKAAGLRRIHREWGRRRWRLGRIFPTRCLEKAIPACPRARDSACLRPDSEPMPKESLARHDHMHPANVIPRSGSTRDGTPNTGATNTDCP